MWLSFVEANKFILSNTKAALCGAQIRSVPDR
jgi:hypothetical protein